MNRQRKFKSSESQSQKERCKYLYLRVEFKSQIFFSRIKEKNLRSASNKKRERLKNKKNDTKLCHRTGRSTSETRFVFSLYFLTVFGLVLFRTN